MTEGIISLTNRDNRRREGWGSGRGGGWINGLIFTQREKQQQLLTILHPSSIFLYCLQCIPAGRHTHASPREQPASIGKLNNSQGQVRTGGDRFLKMTALQGWGFPNQALSEPPSVAPMKKPEMNKLCGRHVFSISEKRANQPAMWNHRGAGFIRVIIFPLHYKRKL